MITHKEVKRFLSNFDYWLNEQTAEMVQKYLSDYITQQEKKDKLLELYRECNKEGVFWLEIQQRIAQLEKELEEMK